MTANKIATKPNTAKATVIMTRILLKGNSLSGEVDGDWLNVWLIVVDGVELSVGDDDIDGVGEG
jgi:hypothetical protein